MNSPRLSSGIEHSTLCTEINMHKARGKLPVPEICGNEGYGSYGEHQIHKSNKPHVCQIRVVLTMKITGKTRCANVQVLKEVARRKWLTQSPQKVKSGRASTWNV